jgi:hypothetical protein
MTENEKSDNGILITTNTGEVPGTATLLRRLPDGRYRLLAQDGDEAFFHKSEYLGGFIHQGFKPLSHEPDQNQYWVAVVRFAFGYQKPACDQYEADAQLCGEHRMILYEHVDREVVRKILVSVTDELWGSNNP